MEDVSQPERPRLWARITRITAPGTGRHRYTPEPAPPYDEGVPTSGASTPASGSTTAQDWTDAVHPELTPSVPVDPPLPETTEDKTAEKTEESSPKSPPVDPAAAVPIPLSTTASFKVYRLSDRGPLLNRIPRQERRNSA